MTTKAAELQYTFKSWFQVSQRKAVLNIANGHQVPWGFFRKQWGDKIAILSPTFVV